MALPPRLKENAMKWILRMLTATLLALAGQAGAVNWTATGHLAFHNQVTFLPFTLDQATSDLKIWTDSFQDGLNFDPILALWQDGLLLQENDDFPYFTAAQTVFDSGLYFASLPAGNYQLSITPFSNFANGPRVEDGFWHSAQTPGPVYRNGNWQLHLTDDTLPPLPSVPEPSPAAMLLAGAALLACWRSARKHTPGSLPRGCAA
jgi:hypothetical protein